MYLQHVNIYVRNAERSKQWYEDLLGLHTYEYRPGWAAFMSADEEQSHEVALMQLGDDAPLQQKGQVGLNHMAWRLESLDDLKEFYHHIKTKGIKPEHISDHGISLGIYLRDPDGNGVEVFYEMPRAEWPADYHIFSRVCQDRCLRTVQIQNLVQNLRRNRYHCERHKHQHRILRQQPL
jgi:catechol 2,3-dioxygenase